MYVPVIGDRFCSAVKALQTLAGRKLDVFDLQSLPVRRRESRARSRSIAGFVAHGAVLQDVVLRLPRLQDQVVQTVYDLLNLANLQRQACFSTAGCSVRIP